MEQRAKRKEHARSQSTHASSYPSTTWRPGAMPYSAKGRRAGRMRAQARVGAERACSARECARHSKKKKKKNSEPLLPPTHPASPLPLAPPTAWTRPLPPPCPSPSASGWCTAAGAGCRRRAQRRRTSRSTRTGARRGRGRRTTRLQKRTWLKGRVRVASKEREGGRAQAAGVFAWVRRVTDADTDEKVSSGLPVSLSLLPASALPHSLSHPRHVQSRHRQDQAPQ